MEAHHNEVEPQTVEAVIVQAADALSGARPGARGESLEQYVKRLRDLEQIATRHEGVDKVYAMQAGREIRVMVAPGALDDDGAVLLSHEIAREIEQELEYPGQIKVTVIRESRAATTRADARSTLPSQPDEGLPRHHLRVPDERARLRAHEGHARVARLREAPERGDADLILFNTCSIREKADERFVAHLHEAKALKRRDPERVIGVGGCWAQSVKDEVFRAVPVRRRRLRPRPGPQARRVPHVRLADRAGLLRVRGLHRPPAAPSARASSRPGCRSPSAATATAPTASCRRRAAARSRARSPSSSPRGGGWPPTA